MKDKRTGINLCLLEDCKRPKRSAQIQRLRDPLKQQLFLSLIESLQPPVRKMKGKIPKDKEKTYTRSYRYNAVKDIMKRIQVARRFAHTLSTGISSQWSLGSFSNIPFLF